MKTDARDEGDPILPQIENGVMAIGDLWDAKTSRRPGFNIFGNQFNHEKSPLYKTAVQTQKVEYFHTKSTADTEKDFGFGAEISVAIFSGLIKVTGGVDFQKRDQKSYSQENITWRCKVDTVRIHTTPSSSDELQSFVDEAVMEKVKNGETTHYVSQVTLGADATGSIDIRQTNTSNKYRVGAFLNGTFSLGLLGGQIKAGAEVSEETQVANYNTTIKLNAVPTIKAPTDLDQFEGLGGLLELQLQKSKFIPALPDANGIPKWFFLVPIEHLISDPKGKTRSGKYVDLDEELIPVLMSLRDFQGDDYCKRKLLKLRPELFKLMSDRKHEITKEVTNLEIRISALASEYNRIIYSIYAEFQYDDDIWESKMFKLLAEILQEQLFNEDFIASEIGRWIRQGNEHLELVVIAEEDETSPIHLFSHPDQVEEWLATENTVKITFYTKTKSQLLSTRQSANFIKIANIPYSLQRLSKGLGNLGAAVGIAYPSASPSAQTEPYLEIKTRWDVQKYEDEDAIEFIIDLIAAMVGNIEASRTLTLRFYNAYAEQLGIALPLVKKTQPYAYGHRVVDMNMSIGVENTSAFAEFLTTQIGSIKVYGSKNELIGGSEDGRWRLVSTVETLNSITHALHSLKCLQQIESTLNVEWAICDFAAPNTSNDSPLLFIMKGKYLEGICVDYLDLLILMRQIAASSTDEDLDLSPLDPLAIVKYPILPARIPFARQVARSFEVVIPNTQQRQPFETANSVAAVHFAARLTTCILEEGQAHLIGFPSAIIHILLQMFDGTDDSGPFELFLKEVQIWWNFNTGQVKDSEWANMLNDLCQFLATQNPYLSWVHDAITILDGIAAEMDLEELPGIFPIPKEEEDPVEGGIKRHLSSKEEDPDPAKELILVLLKKISDHDEAPQELRDNIAFYTPETHHMRVWARFLVALLKVERSRVVSPPYALYLQLLDLVKELLYEERLSRVTQERLVSKFVSTVIQTSDPIMDAFYAESKSSLALALATKSYFNLLGILSSCALGPLQHLLLNRLGKIRNTQDWPQLIKLLQAIWKYFHADSNKVPGHDDDEDDDDAAEFNFWTYLWKNQKFYALMLEHSENEYLLNALVLYQCKPPNIVPTFIPKPFAAACRKLMGLAGDADFEYDAEWRDLAEAVEAFQIIWTRKRMPTKFPMQLLDNTLRFAEFRTGLLQACSVTYFNAELQYFEQPWDLSVLYVVIENSLKWLDRTGRQPRLTFKECRLQNKIKSQDEHNVAVLLQVSPMLARLDSNENVRVYLRYWWQKLQFGTTSVWGEDDNDQPPLLSRIETLSQFIHWTHNSVIILHKLARALARHSLAMPLIVPGARSRDPEFHNLLPAVYGLRLQLDAQSHLLFQTPFRIVTAITIGQSQTDRSKVSSWILNNFLLSHKGTFSTSSNEDGEEVDGYAEFIWLTKASCLNSRIQIPAETTLLVNLHGDALAVPDILRWLAQLTSRFVAFWICEEWSWTEFKSNRRELVAAIGCQEALVLDACVDPSKSITDVIGQENPCILQTNGNETAAQNQLARIFELSLSCKKRQLDELHLLDLYCNEENYHGQIFTRFHGIEQAVHPLIRLVQVESIKSIKSGFMHAKMTAKELESSWNSSPNYVQLMKCFYALISKQEPFGDGLAYLDQELGHLFMFTAQVHRLHEQQMALRGLISTELESIAKQRLQTQLNRVNFKLQREYNMDVQQLFQQLQLIHNKCPHLLLELSQEPPAEFPARLSASFLSSIPLQLPCSKTAVIDAEQEWLVKFKSILGPLQVYVISTVGQHGSELMDVLFGAEKSVEIQSPHAEFRLRLVQLTAEFKTVVFASTGLPIEAIVVVHSPALIPSHREGERELWKDRALLSLILATSHLTLCHTKDQNTEFGEIMEIAWLQQLILPNSAHVSNFMLVDDETQPELREDMNGQLLDILSQVETISSQYTLEAGIQNDYLTHFGRLEGLLEMDKVVYSVEMNHAGLSQLHNSILDDLLSTRAGGSWTFSSWMDSISENWAHISNEPDKFPTRFKNIADVIKELEMTSDLRDLESSIGDAVGFHSKCYITHIHNEMNQIPRQVAPANDNDEPEYSGHRNALSNADGDGLTPSIVKANIRTWFTSRLAGVYQFCESGDNGTPCEPCRIATEQEAALRREYENHPIIPKVSGSCLTDVVGTADQRATHVITCLELKINQLEILADYSKSDLNLTWEQFVSTKLDLIPTWRRFIAEIKDMYPTLVSSAAAAVLEGCPPTESDDDVLEQLRSIPAVSGSEHDNNQTSCTWEEFQLLRRGIKPLAQSLIQPAGSTVETVHFCRGMISKLQQQVQLVISQSLPLSSNNRLLLTSFLWRVHLAALNCFWNYVVKVEEQDWNVRYNPLTYPQLT